MSDPRDFLQFKESAERVPRSLADQTRARIESLLSPPWEQIVLKVIGVQVLIGFLSLGLCHQFGLNPFGTEKSLADLVMQHMGHGACMVFCGFFISVLGWSFVSGLLSIEERRWLHRHGLSTVSVWALTTLLVFLLAGADGLSIHWGALWALGAILAGLGVLKAKEFKDRPPSSSQYGT